MAAKPVDWTVPGILGGLAAVLLLMAAVAFGVDSHLTARVDRVEAWPTTEAVVVVNRLETVDYLEPRTNKLEKRHRLVLEYTYDVGGRSYTGKNVNVDGTGARFDETEYPVGSRMPVRYDPADPAIAGVKMDLQADMVGPWFIVAGVGLAALGLVLAGFATRSLLRQRAATA